MAEATREQDNKTQTVTEVIEEEEVLPPANVARITGTLHLQGRNINGPSVHWTEDTIDNEGLGRKKSKICCIYTRPRNWDDSSSDSSSCSSSDDDDKPNAYEIQPKYKPRSHHHSHNGGCKHK
ncbi:hypothetical protein BCR36DRAFT_584623 [Piromyces finnis]|uniref:Type 1 phosphatases regulator n=1 Tax=Piromyces finnis TaxID=1754191 RepID=A0A1Y1V7P8_9FUNG|nr:hypothetical protein BCR36DRAFT_584623 [Piromyces finnis]|eukprot:ORX47923.1 hypothetical protein BCR36DRAFT_584623 [Piromyces finnis]